MAPARPSQQRFLTAEWHALAMLNYEVEPAILASLVPRGTELDEWKGRTYVSLVCFLFEKTRVLGMAVPFHTDFEEANLRFYVRRRAADGWRRGVVFIKELVPRRAIAWVAKACFNENYQAVPMNHSDIRTMHPPMRTVQYRWRFRREHFHLEAVATGMPALAETGSEEEFITEHYWGYCRQPDGSTIEYRVDHPRWEIWSAAQGAFTGDGSLLYGPALGETLAGPARSALLAEGSPVTVYRGVRLDG